MAAPTVVLTSASLALLAAGLLVASVAGQRITTIQLDGTQYFISRMNPYSPELNYFLAYQYCRSIGLQLASFETKEKADAIMQYLTNAGYNKYDFWTSGNRLGTDMMIWMSTGLPFNATFDYMRRPDNEDEYEIPMARQLSAVEPSLAIDMRLCGLGAGRTMTHQTDAFCCAHQTCTGTRTTVLRSKTSSASRRGATTTTTALSQYLRPRGKRNRIKVTSLPTTPSAVSSTTNASSPASTTPPPTFNPTTSVEPSVEPSGHGTDEDMEMEPEDSDNEPVDGTQSENEADYQPAEGDVTTAFPRSRAHQYTKHAERDRNNDSPEVPAEFPWTWARNIMLEKPVQKKSAQL